MWLAGDHYKWRLMRADGIEEDYITGAADDYDKFKAFMEMLPYSIMNPMYHWYVKLKRYFNEDVQLDKVNISKLYKSLNKTLKKSTHKPQGLIKQSNVTVVCTTDDPCDDLKYHQLLNADRKVPFKVYPTFRPDSYVFLNADSLGQKCHNRNSNRDKLSDFSEYITALKARIYYFDRHGV